MAAACEAAAWCSRAAGFSWLRLAIHAGTPARILRGRLRRVIVVGRCALLPTLIRRHQRAGQHLAKMNRVLGEGQTPTGRADPVASISIISGYGTAI